MFAQAAFEDMVTGKAAFDKEESFVRDGRGIGSALGALKDFNAVRLAVVAREAGFG